MLTSFYLLKVPNIFINFCSSAILGGIFCAIPVESGNEYTTTWVSVTHMN